MMYKVLLSAALILSILEYANCQTRGKSLFSMKDFANRYSLKDFKASFGEAITLYPLRNLNEIDSVHQRFVLTSDKFEKANVSFSFESYQFSYADVYTRGNNIVGFKASNEFASPFNNVINISTGELNQFDTLGQLLTSIYKNKKVELAFTIGSKSDLYIHKYLYKEWDADGYIWASYITTGNQINGKNNLIQWLIALKQDELHLLSPGILEAEFDPLSLFREIKTPTKSIDPLRKPTNNEEKLYKKMDADFKAMPVGDGKVNE